VAARRRRKAALRDRGRLEIPGGGDRPTINGAPATEIFGEIRFGWDF
jgi:hypothetical protein